ncbi:MAG TPA: acyl-CoA dehydrogenase family protein [Gammaproteobacteria bacterium]|nr:acyl-CoA dehydrogenase family protein [Gammaproteobacteria bacterium]
MSEMRDMLLDSARRILADHCAPAEVIRAEQGEWPAALWQALESAGLPLMLVPESLGGSGLDWADALALLRLAGRYSAPVPLGETLLAADLLARAGIAPPSGPLSVAPARAGDAPRLENGDGPALSGTLRRVPWGRYAAGVAVVARAGDDWRVALADPADGVIEEGVNLAGEARDEMRFERAPVRVGEALAEADAGFVLRMHGALVRAAQMTGAMDRALELSVAYAGEREQFGRPIGRFQAIQQQLAVMTGDVAAAGAALEAAGERLGRGDAWFFAAVARTRIAEAAGPAASVAHQVHGAMGFTYEHSLHLSTRRLWSWREEFGSEREWGERIGRALAVRGADALWPLLTETETGDPHPPRD